MTEGRVLPTCQRPAGTRRRATATGERFPGPLYLTLPATSANLGPGFDALGLAISLSLRIEARGADQFQIEATGRDCDLTGALEGNLMLATYSEVLQKAGKSILPLAIRLDNEIPLGMAAAPPRPLWCAGVLLAITSEETELDA